MDNPTTAAKEVQEKMNQCDSPLAGCLRRSTFLENLEYEQTDLIRRLGKIQEKIFKLKMNPYLAEQLEFFLS